MDRELARKLLNREIEPRNSIEQLAVNAIPIDDHDWGSDRQVNAENDFFHAVGEYLTASFYEDNLKATTEEIIFNALLELEQFIFSN